MTPLFTDYLRGLRRDRQRARTRGRHIRTAQRRQHHHGGRSDRVARLRMTLAEDGLPKGGGIGYEIFDKSDALGTTSFVQNINNLRALEGEIVPHHPRARPRPGRPRASGDAGAAAVLARQDRTFGLDRAQGPRHARAAASARHPPSGRLRRQRPQAAARLDRRRNGPAACRRRRRRCLGARSARTSARAAFEKHDARAGRVDRRSSVVGPGRARVASHRRFRFQPRDTDLGQVRSRRPGGALEPDPRGILGNERRPRQSGDGRQRSCPTATSAAPAAAPRMRRRRAIRAGSPRKSSITRFPRPPRPRSSRAAASTASRSRYWSTAPTAKNDKGEIDLSAAQQGRNRADRRAGALRDRLRSEARRPGRGRQSALRRERRRSPISEPTGWLSMLQFTKDDIMRAIEMVVMGSSASSCC